MSRHQRSERLTSADGAGHWRPDRLAALVASLPYPQLPAGFCPSVLARAALARRRRARWQARGALVVLALAAALAVSLPSLLGGPVGAGPALGGLVGALAIDLAKLAALVQAAGLLASSLWRLLDGQLALHGGELRLLALAAGLVLGAGLLAASTLGGLAWLWARRVRTLGLRP